MTQQNHSTTKLTNEQGQSSKITSSCSISTSTLAGKLSKLIYGKQLWMDAELSSLTQLPILPMDSTLQRLTSNYRRLLKSFQLWRWTSMLLSLYSAICAILMLVLLMNGEVKFLAASLLVVVQWLVVATSCWVWKETETQISHLRKEISERLYFWKIVSLERPVDSSSIGTK